MTKPVVRTKVIIQLLQSTLKLLVLQCFNAWSYLIQNFALLNVAKFSFGTLFRWYFSHTPRSDAERVLLTNKNSYGAFLVRCCEIEDANHALSGISEYIRVSENPCLFERSFDQGKECPDKTTSNIFSFFLRFSVI